jgi:hypothetical protein
MEIAAAEAITKAVDVGPFIEFRARIIRAIKDLFFQHLRLKSNYNYALYVIKFIFIIFATNFPIQRGAIKSI